MAGLAARGMRGGILLTILGLSLVGWLTGIAEFGGTAAPPVASAAFALDFSAVTSAAFLSVVFILFFDFFDTTGIDRNRRYCRRRADGSTRIWTVPW